MYLKPELYDMKPEIGTHMSFAKSKFPDIYSSR